MRRRLGAIGLLVLLGVPSAAFAQRGVELGADLGVGMQFSGGEHVFQIAVPTTFRAGFPVGAAASIEPRVAFQLASGGGFTASSLNVTAAALLNLGSATASSRPYVALLPQFAHVSGNGSASQFGVGAGVGMRFGQSERFSPRIELQYIHGFDNDNFPSTDTINALIGFSVFTR